MSARTDERIQPALHALLLGDCRRVARRIEATVLAVATRSRERSDPKYQQSPTKDTWEAVVPELVFEPLS